MNEVFENNTAITSIRNFYMNYRKLILGLAALAILIIFVYLINNQVSKKNNLEAAEIYNKWIAQETDTDEGMLISDELFEDLISSYIKTGYAKIALLNQASLKANNGDLESALSYFLSLKESTEGFSGNKLFNKIARINSARILIVQEKLDDALGMLDIYTSEGDALIHEIIGDILSKQDKKELAIEQYNIAKQNYTNEASISVVSMKITNLSF
jgi:predicted negative regulator of RcsB-dependent stress response